MPDDLKNIVEAVLLAADGPVSVARIQGLFEESVKPDAARVHEALGLLREECDARGVELKKIGSGYRYQTREKYAEYLRRLQAVRPPRLSRALLETLSIIAYRQPVTRGDIETIRGVSVSADIMQRLVERGWIVQLGVRDVPGYPALFGTTPEFLSYFNLSSLKELPDLADQRDLFAIAEEMDPSLPKEVMTALSTEESDQDDIPAGSKDRESADEDGENAGLETDGQDVPEPENHASETPAGNGTPGSDKNS